MRPSGSRSQDPQRSAAEARVAMRKAAARSLTCMSLYRHRISGTLGAHGVIDTVAVMRRKVWRDGTVRWEAGARGE
jgi:hypothetical protein